MARKDLELELLYLRFKEFNPDIRMRISQIVSSKRCKDTSDIVINDIWISYREYLVIALGKLDEKIAKYQAEERDLEPKARELIRGYINDALNYEAELNDLDDDTFENLYRKIMRPIVKEKRAQRALAAEENDRWEFFNRSDAEADFEHWRNVSLTTAQAVALSFEKDPEVVKPETLQPYRRVVRSPFREKFKDRLDVLEMAVAAGELAAPMPVSTFAQWAADRGIKLPTELIGKTASLEDDAAFWKEKYEAAQSALEKLRSGVDDMPPKSRASIYKMIIGMAIARFGHKTVGNTKATSAIKEAVKDLDLKIDEDTILGHLRDAASEFAVNQPTAISWSELRRPMI